MILLYYAVSVCAMQFSIRISSLSVNHLVNAKRLPASANLHFRLLSDRYLLLNKRVCGFADQKLCVELFCGLLEAGGYIDRVSNDSKLNAGRSDPPHDDRTGVQSKR